MSNNGNASGIMKDVLESAITEAKNKFQDLLNVLDKFSFPEPYIKYFSTANINVDKLAQDIPVGSGQDDYIYIFKIIGENKTCRMLSAKMEIEKKRLGKKNQDLPQINHSNNDSEYLYIGRSQKLRNRIRQHLGLKYRGTYAMHMKSWSTSLNEEVAIYYFRLENYDNILVQTVENSLWETLKPCFGRKGEK
jgi:hypothetical protein